MKKIVIFLFIVLQAGLLLAQTNVHGNVSGTWTVGGSPYNVIGNANVPTGQTLTIEPGVTVQFMGNYYLQIYGGLFVVGTETDSIYFTSGQAVPNPDDWQHIQFQYGSDTTSIIAYTRIEYAERGIYCYNASPTISNNTICNNDYCGIYCRYSSSSPTINNNMIYNNPTGIRGQFHATPTINENTIYNGTNGIYCSGSNPGITINKNTIANNSGVGIRCDSPSPDILNNILYNNITGIWVTTSPSSLEYNLFWQNNTDGIGSIPALFGEITTVNANGDSCDVYSNLFMNPMFVDPGSFNFHITEMSPCIDAGNPDPIYYDPDGSIADIGALYYEAALVPLTANFSASPLYGNSPLGVQFTNLSFGLPTAWEWDFQNDGIIDSYQQNPFFTYTQPGFYSVSLTVTNSRDQDTEVKENYIVAHVDQVEPLITDNWQSYLWPYNAYYPLCSNPNHHHGIVNGRVACSCGPIAISRILHYWEFPVQGNGSFSYTDIYGCVYSADFGNTMYEWDKMPYALNETDPEDIYGPTATLTYHVATCVNDVYVTGATIDMWITGLTSYLRYSTTAQCVLRSDYTRDEWINIYKTELENGHPIFVCGDNSSGGGHWFICDGFNDSDEFHFIMSWGGVGDGYYDIDNPNGYSFYNQALIGLQPELNGKELALLSPNGGGTFAPGEETDITWNSENVSDIKIEYTFDNGYNWQEIISSTSTSTGFYTWTVPNTTSNHCKVKLTDVTDVNVYDKSDDVFSIQSYGLMLISPNGGESYFQGNTISITWDNTPIPDIKIEYTADNGLNWIEITACTSAASGSYDWIIPNIISDQCKVKITDITNSTIYDESDNVFSIQSYISIYDIQHTTEPGPEGTYPSLMVGETVTTSGIVTAIGYSGYDANFFISTPDGEPWEGIYVYYADTEPSIGDMVEVCGEVYEYNGFTEIRYAAVTVSSSGNPVPEPLLVNTGDLVAPVNAEAYEGCLVKVENVTVTQEPDQYNQWYIDDGTGECQVDDNIFAYSVSLGEQFTYIIGALDYGYDEYGINPRDMDDLCVYSIDDPSNNPLTLYQNSPNPFSTHTSIMYSLPQSSNVKINIYNLKGQLVKSLVNEDKPAGYHEVECLAENMNNGIYFYELTTENKTFIKKMILMK